MKNAQQTYLLTLNSPSQRALRLWTGNSIHTLRHCSVKQIGNTLVEMQKNIDNLQKSMRTLQQVKEQLVSGSAEGRGETRKMNTGSVKTAARFGGQDNGRVSRETKEAARGRNNRRGPFLRNVSQKGDSRGRRGQ